MTFPLFTPVDALTIVGSDVVLVTEFIGDVQIQPFAKVAVPILALGFTTIIGPINLRTAETKVVMGCRLGDKYSRVFAEVHRVLGGYVIYRPPPNIHRLYSNGIAVCVSYLWFCK